MTNVWRLFFLLLGLGLLAFVVVQVDLSAVLTHVGTLGWGMAAVLFVYFLAFLADTFSWQLLVKPVRLEWRWLYALWKVRMVGAAVNRLTPLIGLGGEAVKAVLLKKVHGVDFTEGIASLIVAKTTNLIALMVFLAGGLIVTFSLERMPQGYETVIYAGFAVLAIGIATVFAIQRAGLSSALGGWLSRCRYGRRLAGLVHHIERLDERLIESYSRDRARFGLAFLLTLANWMLGVVELYLIFWFFGNPVSMAEAWAIEAIFELVRAGAFFIPAGIGAQEAALVLIVAPITGQPSLGLAVALVRRAREVVWIIWGGAIGWWYSRVIPQSPRLHSMKPNA